MNALASRARFNDEVAGLRALGKCNLPGFELRLLEAVYPRVLVEVQHPFKEALVLLIEAKDYPSQAASYLFVEREDPSAILPIDRWPGYPFPVAPKQNMKGHHNSAFRDDHIHWKEKLPGHRGPIRPRPWICMEGTREYHDDHRHYRNHWLPISTRPDVTFAAMAYAIQERVYRVNGVVPAAHTK